MSEDHSDRSVKITASQRAHPAIRTIARACIALAHWQREGQEVAPSMPAEPGNPPRIQAVKPTAEGER